MLEKGSLLLHAGASAAITDNKEETPLADLQFWAETKDRQAERWQPILDRIIAIDQEAQNERSELHAALESHLPCQKATELSRIVTDYFGFLMHESLCDRK
jgi:hypothetical protein